jgi:hypothetical protein
MEIPAEPTPFVTLDEIMRPLANTNFFQAPRKITRLLLDIRGRWQLPNLAASRFVPCLLIVKDFGKTVSISCSPELVSEPGEL